MSENVWSHFGTWWGMGLWIALYGSFLIFIPFYRKAQRKPAGVFLAFVVAFALEMFGLPLTFYFFLWAFGTSLPEGVLWGHTLSPWIGQAGLWICGGLTALGLGLVIAGWSRIHREYWSKEEGRGALVRGGIYRHIRHPQYTGFLLISLGVLFDWATLPLVLLWPVLLALYLRLARREEAEMEERFGADYRAYKQATGRFLPRIFTRRARQGSLLALLILGGMLALPSRSAAEGLSFSSYAEAGAGLSLAGGKARLLVNLDSGLRFGNLELGACLGLIPLSYGSPDLVRAGAVYYGTSIGASLPLKGSSLRPFARLGLGGIAREEADAQGGFDGQGADKGFSCSLMVGASVPITDHLSVRPWAAWRLSPSFGDYAGKSLSGPDLGLALRLDWSTSLK